MFPNDAAAPGNPMMNGYLHSVKDHKLQRDCPDSPRYGEAAVLTNGEKLSNHNTTEALVEDPQSTNATSNGIPGKLTNSDHLPGHARDKINDNGGGQTPIAICGMSMRLPGGISTPQQFWELLLSKSDARARVPQSRYNASAFHDGTSNPGNVASEYGYFLDDDLTRLDASFFNMSRPEVERLDPQQRLMLEAARECFQDAGVTEWRGKTIGCYMGNLFEDWCEIFAKDSQQWGNYRISGYGDFALSNRVSYEMDLQGPSMTVRTACSASLVALHEACVAVLRGDCEAALVGGTNIILTPGTTTSMTEQGVLSKDGSCKTFSADANGYARAEAITALYIKPLADAIRDRNPVRAIIRGTAVNHDGKTPGLTVPSSNAQEACIRKAYQHAGIFDLSQTAFVECHGTGTPVGDPIEAKAVSRVWGEQGVLIGSVKPNVGHTEGTSGLVSVIKTILALENRLVPPNIKCLPANPAIPFASAKLTVPIEATDWPSDRLERASVNSFGVGGTNAHVILDSAASFGPLRSRPPTRSEPQLLLFSANTPKSLSKTIQDHRDFLEKDFGCARDLAFTLANKREHLPCRSFAIAHNGSVNATYPTAKTLQPSSVVMVFTGQGAQWASMGREMLKSNVNFQQSIAALDKYLDSHFGSTNTLKIEEQLRSTGKKLHFGSAEYAQPLCAAVQIALLDALTSVGVFPSAVVGHSSGEIVAAYAAGALTAEEAILIATYRGLVTNESPRSGAMAAIGFGCEQVKEYLFADVVVACDNSPDSVTISGDLDGIESTIASIRKARPEVLTRKLQVDKAYHSQHMLDIGARYEALIAEILCPKELTIPFFSTVTGNLLEGHALDAAYWRRNLESPVLFRTAISCIHQEGLAENAVFLEIGPHSALAGPLRQNFTKLSSKAPYVSAMIRNEDSVLTFLAALGKLHTFRYPLDLQVLMPRGSCLSDLPRYPWDHEASYWYESRLSKEYRQRKYPHHDLLGSKVSETSAFEPSWRNLLHLDSAPWLRDHKVADDIVFPFAAYVAMAGEAARQLSGVEDSFQLRHVVISTALVVPEGGPTELMTALRKQRLTDTLDSKWWEFSISSYNGVTWIKHCTGEVMSKPENPRTSEEEVKIQPLPRRVNVRKWIHALRRAGFGLGPAFCNLEEISAGTRAQEAVAMIRNDRHGEPNKYHLHPTVIDSVVQMISVAFVKGQARTYRTRVPVSCDFVEIVRSPSNLAIKVDTESVGESALGEIRGFADSILCLKMSGLKLSVIDNDAPQSKDTHAAARLIWGPDSEFVNFDAVMRSSIDQALYTPILDELYQLCVRYVQKTKDISTLRTPHLRKFDAWLDDQSSSLASLPTSKADLDLILERMNGLVRDLEDTPASPAAIALKGVCQKVNALYADQLSSWEDVLADNLKAGLSSFINHWDLSPLFQKLSFCNPALRILEISSWRSSPSQQILDTLRLPDGKVLYSEYKFVSEGFVIPSQDQVGPTMVEYSTLDLEEDPDKQGFEGQQYDLIIADNIVHNTRNVGRGLKYLRKLLRPDGYLVLQELCPRSKWINFVFGTHPRWWCGSNDERPEEPYLDLQNWQRKLLAADLESSGEPLLDAIEPLQLTSVLVARPTRAIPQTKQVSLLCKDQDQNTSPILENLETQGFTVAKCTLQDKVTPGQDVIALLDNDGPFFQDIDADTFGAFKSFLESLENSGILWITKSSQLNCRDPAYAQVIGLARTIRSELLIDFATCEIDDSGKSTPQLIQIVEKFQQRKMNDLMKPDFEYSIQDGIVHIGRFYPFALCNEILETSPGSAAKLEIEIPGRLGTLYWSQQPAISSLNPHEVEIEMYSVSLNFRDVLVAMKIVELPERVLGLEGAGIVRRVGSAVKDLQIGDRVATMERGAFSTVFRTLEILCVKIPDNLDLNEASTMLIPYVTAIHSLMTVGNVKKGQSVLIHSACGGVGIAAVQIAQMVGAELYITVGTDEKIQYALDALKIPRNRIFNSRDQSFVDGIMRETEGRGVDLILNSLSGELLHATWRCVSAFGRLVEIGKRDLIGHGKLDMKTFLANRSYCCVDVDGFRENPKVIQELLKSVLELYKAGKITPIPTKVFSAEATCDAFRYMQRGQHIGRICVSLRTATDNSLLEGQIRGQCRSPSLDGSASYLLVGGLGGLGRAVAVWMVEHGARHLIFLSRSAGYSHEDILFGEELNSMDCEVEFCRGSVTDMADVTGAISARKRPLKGILQMSMVLRDENFLQMSMDQWQAAIDPKIKGTWNLHNATASAGINLDFLILFSSLSGVIGQPGQANYAGANTFLDAFVQYRTNLGLAASVVDIGAVADIGYIFENPGLMQKMATTGFKALNEQEVLDAMNLAMTSRTISTNSVDASKLRYVAPNSFVLGLASAASTGNAASRPTWKNDRRMALYHSSSGNEGEAATSSDSLKTFTASAKADGSVLRAPDAGKVLGLEIGKKLCNLLLRSEEELNASTTLADLGMDSLVGIELRAWWKGAFGFDTSVLEMLGKGTLEALGRHAADGLAKAFQIE